MKHFQVIVVFAVLLVFGAAFAIPGVDCPSTPYDESESQPYDCAPQISTALTHVAGVANELQGGSPHATRFAELLLDRSPLVLAHADGLTASPNLVTLVLPIRC